MEDTRESCVSLATVCIACEGAVFDVDSLLSHTAFRYEVERHNNSSSTVKLEKYENNINALGNFELTKASEFIYNRQSTKY